MLKFERRIVMHDLEELLPIAAHDLEELLLMINFSS